MTTMNDTITKSAAKAARLGETIRQRAMLVSLHIATWQARAYDKAVSEALNADQRATPDAARVNKTLLAKESLAELRSVESQLRTLVATSTLPWYRGGQNVLKADKYFEFMDAYRSLKSRHAQAVAAFVTNYPTAVAAAKSILGKMWSAEDYPDPSEIADRFEVDIEFEAIPSKDDFRVTLDDGELEIIKAQIEANAREGFEFAIRDAYLRMYEPVFALSSRLKEFKEAEKADKKGRIHESLVNNIREVCDAMPGLNFTDDPELNKLADKIRKELAGIDVEELRNTAEGREKAEKKADAILAKLEGLFGDNTDDNTNTEAAA